MWKIFANIFSTIDVKDILSKTDDWNLSKEETVKYQLEWLRAMPTGFQIAQRFIGIAFTLVFLIMVLTAFVMLVIGKDIDLIMIFIRDTMSNPIMIIFALFFGGGTIDSLRRNKRKETPVINPEDYRRKAPELHSSPATINTNKPLSRGQRRRKNKRDRKAQEVQE